MCDTMVAITESGILFAKNSDRDANEAQLLEWHPAADFPADARVQATWIAIPQVRHTHAILISRPWWMWGAEMGTNEHGVVIGNEAVFTKEPTQNEPGLLGMDLLRLALERAKNADEAVEVIVSLLERHGQGGPCSHENPGFTYHNGFLVADRAGAVVLETAGRKWATEKVSGPSRSISNGLTIDGFAERYADRLRGWVARCGVRRGLTQHRAASAISVADMFAILRDNGTGGAPSWSMVNGSMSGPNMHAGGFVAASQTVSSWVSDLRGQPLHWATGTADPALGLFKPLRVSEPSDLGQATNHFDPSSLFWRGELLHRTALRRWSRAVETIRPEQSRVEADWLDTPPSTSVAVAEADIITQRWLAQVRALGPEDDRPHWLRWLWARYDRRAGLDLDIIPAPTSLRPPL